MSLFAASPRAMGRKLVRVPRDLVLFVCVQCSAFTIYVSIGVMSIQYVHHACIVMYKVIMMPLEYKYRRKIEYGTPICTFLLRELYFKHDP